MIPVTNTVDVGEIGDPFDMVDNDWFNSADRFEWLDNKYNLVSHIAIMSLGWNKV